MKKGNRRHVLLLRNNVICVVCVHVQVFIVSTHIKKTPNIICYSFIICLLLLILYRIKPRGRQLQMDEGCTKCRTGTRKTRTPS